MFSRLTRQLTAHGLILAAGIVLFIMFATGTPELLYACGSYVYSSQGCSSHKDPDVDEGGITDTFTAECDGFSASCEVKSKTVVFALQGQEEWNSGGGDAYATATEYWQWSGAPPAPGATFNLTTNGNHECHLKANAGGDDVYAETSGNAVNNRKPTGAAMKNSILTFEVTDYCDEDPIDEERSFPLTNDVITGNTDSSTFSAYVKAICEADTYAYAKETRPLPANSISTSEAVHVNVNISGSISNVVSK